MQRMTKPFAGGDQPLRASRLLRASVVCLLTLSLVPLGFGIASGLPSGYLNRVAQALSEKWERLIYSLPWNTARPQQAENVAAGVRSWVSVPVAQGGDHGVAWYGDRLKITFLESLSLALDGAKTGTDQVVDTIFPRMDLSAEYLVDEDGNISVPRLGTFPAVGQPIAALQSALAAAFQRALGRSSDVAATVVERQPIYILGMVRNAGSFRYTPGMTVLQALANAGGANDATVDTSRAIENIRETERLHRAEEQLNHLLLNQAVLIAERSGSDGIVVPPDIQSRLAQAGSHGGIDLMLAGATARLGIERKSYQERHSLAERQVGIARYEREAQNLRGEQLQDLLAKKQAKLHEMEHIAARGSVSQFKITDMSADVADLTARQQDLRAALAQAERGLVEAEAALTKLDTEHSVELEKAITAGQQEIDDCRRSIASMQAVTRILSGGSTDGVSGPLGFKVTRRVPDGMTVMDADETTWLMPGDVLQVTAVNAPDPATAGPGSERHFQN
ncbi:MAG TPA: polysaccharide biosynthesis/export family protein [Acetobacteraceae bacterium]|nr:polysaccharide biosynthesis/export family protein [Acetobacteraceae bacterium]